MKKICINCGKEYETKSKKSKYCSERCKGEFRYNNKKIHLHTCKNCGKEFLNNRLDVEFCSKSCATKYQRNHGITIYKIADVISKNNQISVHELSSILNTSQKTIYNLLNKYGYHSYMEFVGTVKGVYIQKNRSDTSISALRCFEIISNILHENYELEVSFDGLVNKITGRKLRIDCYFKNSNIAVEYNGIQHYEFVPFFHTDKNSFEYQKYKDSEKVKYCNSHGIKLIIVSYKEPLTVCNLKKLLSRDNQQPSQMKSDNSNLEGSETNE